MIDWILRTVARLRGRAWYRAQDGSIRWARSFDRGDRVEIPGHVIGEVLRQSEDRARREEMH